jgi:hypothetical protein
MKFAIKAYGKQLGKRIRTKTFKKRRYSSKAAT